MKLVMRLSLLLLGIFNGNLQAQTNENDSIRIIVDPLIVKYKEAPSTLGEEIAIRLAAEIQNNGNLVVLEKNDTKYRKFMAIIRKDLPISNPSDIPDSNAVRLPNYYVYGEVLPNTLSVNVMEGQSKIKKYSAYVDWATYTSISDKKASKAIKELATLIISGLVDLNDIYEARTLLIISTNDSEVQLRIDKKAVDLASAESIKVRRGRKGVEVGASSSDLPLVTEDIKLEDLFINRAKVKRKSDRYKIYRLRTAVQAAFGSTLFSNTPAPSLDLDLRYLIGSSISAGLHFEWHNIKYEYPFDTFRGISPINQSERFDLVAMGLVLNYEQYQSPINLIWNAELNLNAYPNQGVGCKLGAALEKFPALQLKVGYRILMNAEVEQAVFNPFGNATYERVEETFGGFYIGLNCNIWL
ncbi:MAG: hypothetical protein AAF849_03220 [Bacteroidota bacterium]